MKTPIEALKKLNKWQEISDTTYYCAIFIFWPWLALHKCRSNVEISFLKSPVLENFNTCINLLWCFRDKHQLF